MSQKDSKEKTIKHNNSITSNFIIILISILSIFFESILIIISLFRKGILKREVLSEESNLGFDLIIKRKK